MPLYDADYAMRAPMSADAMSASQIAAAPSAIYEPPRR